MSKRRILEKMRCPAEQIEQGRAVWIHQDLFGQQEKINISWDEKKVIIEHLVFQENEWRDNWMLSMSAKSLRVLDQKNLPVGLSPLSALNWVSSKILAGDPPKIINDCLDQSDNHSFKKACP